MGLRRMSEIEQQKTADLDWAVQAPEVQQNPDHYGKFVVVYKRRVLGYGTDCGALLKQIAEREQIPWQHLQALIVPRPEVFEIAP